MDRTACFLVAIALVGACNQETPDGPPLEEDPNAKPTGSIQVPSLCSRTLQDDLRLTMSGADSFAMLWAQDHLQLAYVDVGGNTLYTMRVGPDGAPLEAPNVVAQGAGAAQLPHLVRWKEGFALAWQETGAQPTVRVRALDRLGAPIGESHVIATGRSPQLRPVLAPTDFGLAVAWMDQVAREPGLAPDIGESSSFVAMLDEELAVRADTTPIQLNAGSRQGYPWLIGGKQLGVLWSDDMSGQTSTYFSVVGPELALPAPTAVRDPGASSSALLGRVGTTAAGYITAWEDLRSGSEEIYMALLDPEGVPRAGGLVEEPGTGSANWPHMDWAGVQGAVVYYQFRRGRPQVFVTFIDLEGQRVAGAADAQISNTPTRARFPDVVWSGEAFVVVWVDSRDGQTELYFNRAVCDRPAPI